MYQERETFKHYLEQITLSEERIWKRTARELHDSSMQNLANVQLQLETLKRSLPDRWDVQLQVEVIQDTLREANQSLRYLFSEMDTSTVVRQGLCDALSDFISNLQLHNPGGPEIGFSATGYEDEDLEANTRLILYRCIQQFVLEAATESEKIAVSIEQQHSHVVGRIQSSDGTMGDFSEPLNTSDTEAWQGRLVAVEGELTLTTDPGGSRVILITVPVSSGDSLPR